jgi:hypothetical protein
MQWVGGHLTMQAITTKFLGPTNFKPSRIKAVAGSFEDKVSATVSWEYGASNGTGRNEVDANHDRAAVELIKRLGWFGTWIRGHTENGCVYVSLRRSVCVGFRTPHPQAVSPLDTINVHEDGSVS